MLRTVISTLLASVLCPALASDGRYTAESFEFALIGDMPYGVITNQSHSEFVKLTEAINADGRIKWLLHAGDIKSSKEPCSDEIYNTRLAQLNRFKMPVILTPGDNDWTDCHRALSGGYPPLERLAVVRRLFYPKPGVSLGGTTKTLTSQAKNASYKHFPENVRWIEHNVVFATLHIVGSRNGLAPFQSKDGVTRGRQNDEEVNQRTAAALAWLRETFALANERDSAGVFLMMHANPGLERSSQNRRQRAPYKTLLTALETEVIAFGKPVVLAHGDSHYFRIDKPVLADAEFLTNFTRVETFGAPWVHWIRVVVMPQHPAVFAFFPEILPH